MDTMADGNRTTTMSNYNTTEQTVDQVTMPMSVLISYSVIALTGLTGNIFVVLTICLLKRLRTVSNIFVTNLSLAHVLLGVHSVFVIIEEADPDWELPITACQVIGFLSFFSPIAIVLSMVIIANNRYTCIIATTRTTFSKSRVTLYLAIVWTISFLIALPLLVGWVSVSKSAGCACCFNFSENMIYGLVVTATVYVLPNFLILYYYIRIIIYVRNSRLRVTNHVVSTQRKRHDLRLAAQFVVIFIFFNLCYMPSLIVIWIGSAKGLSDSAIIAANFLFALNLIVNPVVYFIFNKYARRELYAACCRKRGQNWSQNPSHENHSRLQMVENTASNQPPGGVINVAFIATNQSVTTQEPTNKGNTKRAI